MIQKESVLFITDERYVNYEIAGGVQICTTEFLKYFEICGYEIIIIKVSPKITFAKRLKLKLGIEAYDLYDINGYNHEIIKLIKVNQIKKVFINQLNISSSANKIRSCVNPSVKFIGLSHGNESGDFLHDISTNSMPSLLQTWRLGKLLLKEKVILSQVLDAIITISDHDKFIDEWLGAKKTFSLPRILSSKFLKRQQIPNTIGFIGTLDHGPNIEGIKSLAKELQSINFDGKFRIVGGPIEIGTKLQKQYKFIQYCGTIADDDLIEEVKSWSIFVNPIFWYARGSSMKVAQMINWGVPILSTPAGVRGYQLSDNSFIIEGNSHSEMAKKIVQALKSDEILKELTNTSEENAREFNLQLWSDRLKIFLESIS